MPEQHDPNRGRSAAELMRRRAAEEAARAEAINVVVRWNRALSAGRGALWSPTIRCAVAAGAPWLDVYCPGCRTSVAIDIRTIDRHPLASVGSLVLGLRCSLCPDSAAMPYALPLRLPQWARSLPSPAPHRHGSCRGIKLRGTSIDRQLS
jgi:hypothetical protein